LRARVEAQRLARDAYASQFDIGTRDLLDLLDAENELLVSRATLATAEYTERFAVYRVLATVGRMLDALACRGRPRPSRPPARQDRSPPPCGALSVAREGASDRRLRSTNVTLRWPELALCRCSMAYPGARALTKH
jgi:hypothetical protein